MTWTTPRDWSTGEFVTEAMMDTHIKDNFNAVEHLIVRKTSDETVTSNTTVQADDALIAAVGASDVWRLNWSLGVTADPAGDFRFGWTFPASGTFYGMYLSFDGSNTVHSTFYDTSTPTNEFTMNIASATNVTLVNVWSVYVGGGTAGNVTLQWAQVTSSGTATTVKANSIVSGIKLA